MVVSGISSSNSFPSGSKDLAAERMGSTTGCGPGEPKECITESFTCPNGDDSKFKCIDEPGSQPSFSCDESDKFNCGPAETFTCVGDYTCQSQLSFSCDTDIFRCDSIDPIGHIPSGKFHCIHNNTDFDCVGNTSFDFICDSQQHGGTGTQGFDCPSLDASFQCDRLHVFRCESRFTCPETHTCLPPRTACSEETDWSPGAGEDDDGVGGDFDCFNFTCNGDSQHPEQKFDCKAGSQFKCLDKYSGNFECGENSSFECGEEHEGFVCHDYNCANAFHCTEAFICGDLTGALPFECSGTTPETAFSCLAIPMPLPGWLTYDCGGGPSWEHCFKCHDTPWPTESFKCPAFNCNGVFHP